MAIGTAMAIGLGASALGGVMSAKSAKKGAKTAAATSQQVANDNNALATNMYSQNAQRLDPYGARGNAAGGQINALLGLGGDPQAAQNAFNQYQGSTGYQFRLGEGMNALNSGYAGSGLLQSGAAMKGAVEYGQGFASNEFGNYMNMLGNQQNAGLAGASALAGVGQNMVGQVTANNNANGTNQANAALYRSQNGIGNSLGMIGGGLMGAFS